MVDMAKLGALALLTTTMACGGTVDVFGAGGAAGDGGGDPDEPIVIAGTGGQGASGATGGGTEASTGSGAGTSSGSGAASGSGGSSTGSGGSTSTGSGGATSTGSGGSTSTGGSTGSGTFTCDNTGVCDSCVSCAWNGPCQGYASACLGNPDCVSIMQCYQQCTADDCTTPCWIPFPNGHADYLAASICVTCDNCFADCDGANVGCPENP